MTRLYGGLSSTGPLSSAKLERLRQILKHVRRRILECRLMALGQNPGLKRETRRIRRKRQKIFVLGHHSRSTFDFLPDHVAEDAALFVDVILLRALQFLDHVNGQDGQAISWECECSSDAPAASP